MSSFLVCASAARPLVNLSIQPNRTVVLFKDPRSRQYWPGLIKGFKPASTARERKKKGDRYQVWDVLGDRILHLPRTDFFTDKDEVEYANCKVSRYADPERPLRFHADIDARMGYYIQPGDIRRDKRKYPCTAADRSITPPLPSDDADFSDWSHQDQLVAIRPHLQSIINESYPPATRRIGEFYQPTGAAGISAYGDVSEQLRAQVYVPELERWATGATTGATRRPTGSPRYEQLNSNYRSEVSAKISKCCVPVLIFRLRN